MVETLHYQTSTGKFNCYNVRLPRQEAEQRVADFRALFSPPTLENFDVLKISH